MEILKRVCGKACKYIHFKKVDGSCLVVGLLCIISTALVHRLIYRVEKSFDDCITLTSAGCVGRITTKYIPLLGIEFREMNSSIISVKVKNDGDSQQNKIKIKYSEIGLIQNIIGKTALDLRNKEGECISALDYFIGKDEICLSIDYMPPGSEFEFWFITDHDQKLLPACEAFSEKTIAKKIFNPSPTIDNLIEISKKLSPITTAPFSPIKWRK